MGRGRGEGGEEKEDAWIILSGGQMVERGEQHGWRQPELE